jgi:hypothetical protein
MKATVMEWSEVEPGSTVVMQGTLMKFLRYETETSIPEMDRMLFLVMEFEGHEMHTGVYDDWLVAVVDG